MMYSLNPDWSIGVTIVPVKMLDSFWMISFLVPKDFTPSQLSRCPLYYPSSLSLLSSSISVTAFKLSTYNDVIFQT